jgi:5'-nucleotidase
LGYQYQNPQKPDDLKLAARTENIDLIIGGHTHTFLDRPTITNNRKNEQILVNQVGCFGINLGRIDYYFDDAKENVSQGVSIKV